MSGPVVEHETVMSGEPLPCDPESVVYREERPERSNGGPLTLSVWYVPEDEATTEETLRKLHDRFTSLEGAVEDAINDLRGGGTRSRHSVAKDLEAALEGR